MVRGQGGEGMRGGRIKLEAWRDSVDSREEAERVRSEQKQGGVKDGGG